MTQRDESSLRRFRRTDTLSIADSDDPGSNAYLVNDSYNEYIQLLVYNGEDRPNFRSLIRSHGNATNPAGASRTQTEVLPGSGQLYIKRWRSGPDPDVVSYEVWRTEIATSSGALLSANIVDIPVDDGTAVNKAQAGFVSKARQAMSPASGGTILGELRETLHMIRRPASGIRSRLSSYLSTVKRNGRGLRKASITKKNAMVAETWLEYSFGWTPLLHDIDDSMKALAQLTTGIVPTTPVRSFAKSDAFVSEETLYLVGAGSQTGQVSQTTIDTCQAVFYGAVSQTVAAGPSFRQAFGLRAHDVIPTIWELIPYSFVVDYFTNIGDIISAASYCTADLAWWGESHSAERVSQTHNFADTTIYYQDFPSATTSSGSFSPGSIRRSSKTFGRSVNPSLVPSLSFKIPGTPSKGFNLAALIAQAHNASKAF